LLFLCILLCLAFYSCTNPIYLVQEKYMPYNYPGTVWASNEPKITYTIPINPEDDAIAETEIDGKRIEFIMSILYNHVDAQPIEAIYIDDNGEKVIDGESVLFTGNLSCSKDKFIIYIDKDTDTLFGGKYSKMVFEKTTDLTADCQSP